MLGAFCAPAQLRRCFLLLTCPNRGGLTPLCCGPFRLGAHPPQVPQFLLEAQVSAGTGGACNIICTQPRRISAVGLATRVAAERGETVGASVGYRVRLESRCSHRTRLVFCTIGELNPDTAPTFLAFTWDVRKCAGIIESGIDCV